MTDPIAASVSRSSERTAASVSRWLVGVAQAALMLLALDNGVRTIEWFSTLLPGAGWLTYLVIGKRWAAGVALVGMLAIVPVSLDWLTRAALAAWALYLLWEVIGARRVRVVAGIALVATVARTFEQLRLTSGRVNLATVLALCFWLAYAFFFYMRSRAPATRSGSILELS